MGTVEWGGSEQLQFLRIARELYLENLRELYPLTNKP